jgi:hypothetical protein
MPEYTEKPLGVGADAPAPFFLLALTLPVPASFSQKLLFR